MGFYVPLEFIFVYSVKLYKYNQLSQNHPRFCIISGFHI